MKNILLMIFMVIAMSVVNGQSHLPIVLGDKTQPSLSVYADSVIIDGIIPITMTSINYRVHQYDENSKIHYWGFGYRTDDGCNIMDQEFGLWITEDSYFYSYIDYCSRYMIWNGDNILQTTFRSTIQLPLSYDFNNRK